MNKSSWTVLAASLCLSLSGCVIKKNAGPGGRPGGGSAGGGENPQPNTEQARSIAAFNAMGKVLTSPRCINCHPSGDRPTQGDKMQPHQPPVFRGAKGHGEIGMRCVTCHGDQNYTLLEKQGSIPGLPNWHLAPASMAWQNKSLHEICVQLRDPARNGGKTVEQILEHHTNDALVKWAWNPGEGRAPAPGTHADFVKLTQEWVATGAHCPNP